MKADNCFSSCLSASDDERRGEAAQERDDAEAGDLSRARIFFRPDVLNRHREARALGIDLDAMQVALDPRTGPDLEPRPFRPDAREAECGGDVDVRRES